MGKNTFGNNSQGWLIKKPGNEFNIGWTYVPNEMNFHPVNFGEWEHIALCFDDSSNSLVKFINGEEAQSWNVNIGINASPYEFVIGKELGTQNWFKGAIDELRISDVVRYTQSFDPEVTHMSDSNTLGLWHFDEGEGSVAEDASANGNDMSLVGTDWIDGAFESNSSMASCPQSYQLLRTFTATDECGNSTSATQTITIQDTTAPTFNEALPMDMTVECDQVPEMAMLTATDNCQDVTVLPASSITSLSLIHI